MVFLPPSDESDRGTNENSGDKNELRPNNLNRSQILAGATVYPSISSSNISQGAAEKKEVADPSVNIPSMRDKGSKVDAFL